MSKKVCRMDNEAAKRVKQIQKYVEKKERQRKRDDLLRQIGEISKNRGQSLDLNFKEQLKKRSAKRAKKLKEEEESEETEQSEEEYVLSWNPVEITNSIPVVEEVMEEKTISEKYSLEQRFVHSKVTNRREDMVEWRKSLDIFYEEDEIVSAIKQNLVTFICGETGCGKTTQIPQFLLEAGFGSLICLTQPRKFSAKSVSARINEEVNDEVCGYKIKYENTVTEKTKIKVVTEGVLLKEILSDFLLTKYTVVILDEIHERSINMDLLIGLLSKIIKKRYETGNPLRIVLMSATPCFDIFRPLFGKVPIIELTSKAHKVSIFYETKTPQNYLKVIAEKISTIVSATKSKKAGCLDNDKDAAILVFLPGKEEIYTLKGRLEGMLKDVIILPLHSGLTSKEQSLVYPKYEKRKIILSTNIAETSITIPDVVFVIDSGLVKYCIFDELCTKYIIACISKSSAKQRTGRAGRTKPGVCFRIYSGDKYEQFAEHSPSEVQMSPLDGVVLFLKSLGIKNVLAFPFPEAPEVERIDNTFEVLETISAVTTDREITDKGIELSKYPLNPQIANIICVEPNPSAEIFIIASILSLGIEIKKNSVTTEYYSGASSDLIVALRVVIAYYMSAKREKFARSIGISRNLLDEVSKLTNYLLSISSKEPIKIFEIILSSEKEAEISKRLYKSFMHHLAVNSGEVFIYKSGEISLGQDSVSAADSSMIVFSHIIAGAKREYAKNITIVDPLWYK